MKASLIIFSLLISSVTYTENIVGL